MGHQKPAARPAAHDGVGHTRYSARPPQKAVNQRKKLAAHARKVELVSYGCTGLARHFIKAILFIVEPELANRSFLKARFSCFRPLQIKANT
jgi:hypothetical protein